MPTNMEMWRTTNEWFISGWLQLHTQDMDMDDRGRVRVEWRGAHHKTRPQKKEGGVALATFFELGVFRKEQEK